MITMKLFDQPHAGPAHDFDETWFEDMATLFARIARGEHAHTTQDQFGLAK